MVYIKTKEGASLLVALLAAVIVAVTTTLLLSLIHISEPTRH